MKRPYSPPAVRSVRLERPSLFDIDHSKASR